MSDYIPNYQNHSIFYGNTHGFKAHLPCESQTTRYKYKRNSNAFLEQVKENNKQNEFNSQLCSCCRKGITECSDVSSIRDFEQNEFNSQLCSGCRKGITECSDVSSIRDFEQHSATLTHLNEARIKNDMEGKYATRHERTVQAEHDRSLCQLTNDKLCPEREKHNYQSIAADRKNAKQVPDYMDHMNNIRKRKAQTPLVSKTCIKESKYMGDLHIKSSTLNNAAAKEVDDFFQSQTFNRMSSNLKKKPTVFSEISSDHGKRTTLHFKDDGSSKLGHLLPKCLKRSCTDRVNLQVLENNMDDTDCNINLFLERIRHLEERIKTYNHSDMSCYRHESKIKYTDAYPIKGNKTSYNNFITDRVIENSRSDTSECSLLLETCKDPATSNSGNLMSDNGSDIDSMICYL